MTNKCQYIFVVSREKQKAELKDRRVLEILQVKDIKIQTLEQVLSLNSSCSCSHLAESSLNSVFYCI